MKQLFFILNNPKKKFVLQGNSNTKISFQSSPHSVNQRHTTSFFGFWRNAALELCCNLRTKKNK